MAEPTEASILPGDVPDYRGPATVAANVPDQAAVIAALAQQLAELQARLTQAGISPPEPPKSPEELAREALDRGGHAVNGAHLGIVERLDELHRLVDLVAQKVGI